MAKKDPGIKKYIALIALTVQNVAVVMLSSYARKRDVPMFYSTTAVVMSEVFKLLMSLFLVWREEQFSFNGLRDNLRRNILADCRDNVLITIPGILYMIQNNLLYVSYSNLNPSVFQVSYQLKLLTTAVFSRIILSRLLSKEQWFALVLLFLGVAATNVDFLHLHHDTSVTAEKSGNFYTGFSAVLCACMLSGVAGVYFEKLLKGSHKSVAIRNIQLGFIGFISGFGSVLVKEYEGVSKNGFFHGYDALVWTMILVQSLGGLLVAAVVKHADSILKGYATSMSIVITFALSALLLGSALAYNMYFGSALVVISTLTYTYFPYVPVENVIPIHKA